MDEQLVQEICRIFGVDELRAGQERLMDCALRGLNVLGVLPTGYGKSLCYQAAAQLMGGTSVVVSPLIALMRDQVQSLQRRGIAAARFDSTLCEEARSALLADVAGGRLRLLFVAPESLESPSLLEALRTADKQLFVVDEAHCVSEWGHSFRPDYLKLSTWMVEQGFRSVMALTATATLRVQEDLCRAFDIDRQNVVALSPYRSQITRLVRAAAEPEKELLRFLRLPQHRPAIVYTRTRKGAELLAGRLQQFGLNCACYHAGQTTEQREELQDDFLSNKKDVLVATIAFGMGVDKPDVRSVVHYNLPSSPESYLQESGRAGRDGQAAVALVLLHGADIRDARNRVLATEPDPEGVLRAVRMLLPVGGRAVSLWELGTQCDVPDDVATRALDLLQQAGAVRISGRGYKYYKARPLFSLSTILDGRAPDEKARLKWLDANRNGEVESAALAWDCTFCEALEQLRECERSGEWKLTFRQQALCLETQGPTDARSIAAELSTAYARRTSAAVTRMEQLLTMLTGASGCLNNALERYFTGRANAEPCGHCFHCLRQLPGDIPPPGAPPQPPPLTELPEFARTAQRRRFLLGLSSPAIMARRLWSHPHYGACSGAAWEDL